MRSVEALYYKPFSIPRAEIMLVASLFAALLLSLLDASLLYLWALVFAVSLAALKVAKLKFDLKRISFLAIFITTLSTPAVVLKGNATASAFVLFITYYFCSERKALSVPLASLPYIALSPQISTLIGLLISTLLFLLYIRILDVKVGVVRIRNFVEKFVLFWLTSNPKFMEEFLEDSADDFEGRVRCLAVNEARLVQTDFHPGPFRNVGGAMLVEKLSDGGIYLHSPTSHARNPVSAEEVEKIVSAVRCSEKALTPQKPFKVESENFEAYCFPFAETRMVFVSGKRHIDDFIINSESFVVDCHNAYEENYDPDEGEVGEIARLVKVAEERTSEPSNAKSAFVRVDAETDSLCGYAAAVLLDYGEERYAIVVFDANNVDLRFRRHVEKLFGEMGYTAVVASTDNHAKTGMRAKLAYKPAGQDERDWEVAEKLANCCREAELKDAVFSYGERRVKVKVMGEKLLRDAEVAVERRAKGLIATFLAFAATNYLLSTMLRFIA